MRTYTATLTGQPGQAGDVERQIELTVYVHDAGDGKCDLLWIETQRDVREFSWLHRLGHTSGTVVDGNHSSWPTIRFDWGEGVAYVPVLLAIPTSKEALTDGRQWESDGLNYEVGGQQELGDLKAWRVSVRNNFGEKRIVLVEPSRPTVLGMKETVFLGQGQQHALNLELQTSQAVDDQLWEKLIADFNRFDELRTQLGGATQQEDYAWTDEQLQSMKQALAKMHGQITTEPFQKLLQVAESESKFQRGRAGALDEMRRQALSRKLPGFEFETVIGEQLVRGDLDNGVTVIHFWDYRDAPLREPYGQAGYLDFLFRKYEDDGVRVLGVVVNQQAETPAQRRGAAVSARKFASFMNLAYPLYIDTSTLLKEIGDPRTCDAPLPLFVVIGRDGQILHYSAGYYRVEANQGLAELEAVVKQALGNAE
jgi:hypothetical protein